MLVSDALSRVYIKTTKPELCENNLHFSNERLKQSKEETKKKQFCKPS